MTDSVRKQLAAMRNGMRVTPMKRTPMRRKPAIDRDDSSFYLTAVDGKRWLWPQHWMSEADWEGTLVDWAFKLGGCLKTYHVEAPQRGERGFWDRVWCFKGRGYLSEQKVRDRNGDSKRPTRDQLDYHYAGLAAKFDSRQWQWPDDCFEAWRELTGRPDEDCPYYREVMHG